MTLREKGAPSASAPPHPTFHSTTCSILHLACVVFLPNVTDRTSWKQVWLGVAAGDQTGETALFWMALFK